MIYFDKLSGGFILSGKNYSYAMFVNRAGYLQHLYYGKKNRGKGPCFFNKDAG